MKKSNIGIIIVVVLLVSFLCGGFSAYFVVMNSSSNGGTIIKTSNITLSESDSISASVDKVYDSVVVIEGYKKNELASTGTGFIYKKNGDKFYVMTNHHVVSGCDNVKVILSDKTEIDASVKGSEAYSDIAVLSIETSKNIKVAIAGDSSKVKVGDTVFAVGSPEGADYAGTVTKGIISGKDRLVAVALSNSKTSDYYMKVLQTDAAINPGNSGGPICNINGEVIGITNMKLVDNSVEGMGFAIPIEDALYYAGVMENGKKIERPYFGISMVDVSNGYYLWQNKITIPDNVREGIVVMEVSDKSPAREAGIKKGDIIVELGGEKISSAAEFRYELYKHKVNEKVSVKYIRDNKEHTIKVTLSKGSSN